MEQLKKYIYNESEPISKPYNEKGIFNSCYKALETETDRFVSITEFQEPRYERLLIKHKRLIQLKQVKHPHLAQIYDAFIDSSGPVKKLYVITEWLQGGNLYQYQKVENTLDYQIGVVIVKEITSGLKALHDAELMHRHINMENIEFDINGHAKLTYKCFYPKTIYLSPEEKQGKKNKENDIFSLGILLYKLMLSSVPFKGNTIEQEIQSVSAGVKFPKNEDEIFPLSVPIEVKNLITSMTALNPQSRASCDQIISSCATIMQQDHYQELSSLPFSSPLRKKIFKESFIPLHIRSSSIDEHVVIGLNPEKNEFGKIHIIKSKQSILEHYVKDTLENYIKVKDILGIVPIYEHSIVDNEYLIIRSFYDNQGSLKFYLEKSGTITNKNANVFISQLTEKLKLFGRTHNHLTNQNILIRRGHFYINYPPVYTKSYQQKLKKRQKDVTMIAPEIKEGKTSENADAWSVAMLKYMLENEQMPKFDKKGNLVLNKVGKNPEDIKFYENYLIKDPEKRHSLFKNGNVSDLKQEEIDIVQLPEPIVLQRPATVQKPAIVPKKPKQKIIKKAFGEILAEKFALFLPLQKHWTKPIRVSLKCIIGIIMMIFLFYWNFFLIDGQLIAEHSLFVKQVVLIRAFQTDTVPDIQYELVTKSPTQTYDFFYNQTLSTLRYQYKCVLNDYSVNSDVAGIINTPRFTAYQVFGILFAIINLIMFCLAMSKMDFPKIYFVGRFEENDFTTLWNWMFINMALASQISCVYLLYGSLFHMALEPCLQKPTLTAVEFLLKNWQFSFNIRFIWIYIGLIFSYFVVIFFIAKPTFICNRYIKAGLIILYFTGAMCRIMGGSGDDIAWTKESVFGKIGQLLLLIISIIFFVLDLVFGCCIKEHEKSTKVNRVGEQSIGQIHDTDDNFFEN